MIPIYITPEAEARVAELCMQPELQEMLAYTEANVPELVSIDVQLVEPYDTGDETSITLEATTTLSASEAAHVRHHWRTWQLAHMPVEACVYFRLWTIQPVAITNAGARLS